MDTWRMLEIGFCLRDYPRNSLHTPAQIRNSLFWQREIPRDQEVKAVSQALVVKERVPIRLLQLFSLEDLVVDILPKNAEIDIVCAGGFRSVDNIEFPPKLLLCCQFFGP